MLTGHKSDTDSKPTDQNEKDFRKLESTLIKMCTPQCLRKERSFESETELCMTKCFDYGFIYMRIGLAEINEFTYERQIKS